MSMSYATVPSPGIAATLKTADKDDLEPDHRGDKLELLVEGMNEKLDVIADRVAARPSEDAAEAVEACMARMDVPLREREAFALGYVDARRHRGDAREVAILAFHSRLEFRRITGRRFDEAAP